MRVTNSMQWSPDGRWLAFVTEREANVVEPFAAVEKEIASKEAEKSGTGDAKPAAKQVWMISPDGGESWPLTKSETAVENFHWAHDGKSTLFTATEHPSKARKKRYSAYDGSSELEAAH